MQTFIGGVLVGATLGVFLGIYFSNIPVALRATGIGFGAGIGIFAVGALLRYVADRTDKAFGRIKEGKGA